MKTRRRVAATNIFHKAVLDAVGICKEGNVRRLQEMVEDNELLNITHQIREWWGPELNEETQEYEYPFMPTEETHGPTDYRALFTTADVYLTDEDFERLSTKGSR